MNNALIPRFSACCIILLVISLSLLTYLTQIYEKVRSLSTSLTLEEIELVQVERRRRSR